MNIRRYYVPNAIVFITQVVERRTPIFQHQQFLALLRTTLNNVKQIHPFITHGYAFLPDHFHLLIQPTGQSNFSAMMHSFKPNFTKQYKALIGITGNMRFWQKGFWDHVIRDEIDFQRHIDYIHFNPVHHQLATKPEEWPHTSYHDWLSRHAYAQRWGWSLPDSIKYYDWEPAEADTPQP